MIHPETLTREFKQSCVEHAKTRKSNEALYNSLVESTMDKKARSAGFLNWVEVYFWQTADRDMFTNHTRFICVHPDVVGRDHTLPILRIERQR